MIVSIIVAMTKNHVIGRDGFIPWKIPGEQKRFKELTTGKTIIIGRKSQEEIGDPLPDRKTIILSKTRNIIAENCITVQSLEDALYLAKNEDEVFIAGGGQLYQYSLPYTDKIYLTIIDKCYEGNVYFPAFNKDDFEKIYEKRVDGQVPYTVYTFKRKDNAQK